MTPPASSRTCAPASFQTEAAFQSYILSFARIRKWLGYHTHDSRRSTPGFPDLVLIRRDRLLVAELKLEKGRLGTAQGVWLAAFEQVAETYLWRPSDLPEIQRVLM
jgi:hypothetical protein